MAVLKNIVSKIFNLSTTPFKKTEGQFWYDTTNNILKRSDGTDYKPLPVGDNLISAGSTDTVKGILDSKANYSDLISYLPLTGGTIARYEENPSNPILTIQDTRYSSGAGAMAGLLVKGGYDNGQDYVYYSTYIRPNEITGDAVTSSVTSNSNKLLTSGGAYTALQNKQDKLSFYQEVTSPAQIASISTEYISLTGTNQTSIEIDGYNSQQLIFNSEIGVSGTAVVSTLGTSATSSKLPTEGAVVTAVKALNTSLANKQDKLQYYTEAVYGDGSTHVSINAEDVTIGQSNTTIQVIPYYGTEAITINSANGVNGTAIATTLGTSTTSAKLPTEGAVIKAISDVKTSLGSALTYEGSVANYSNLPIGLTASDKGKVYNVVNANGNIPAGTNYAWNGTSWDALGGDYTALKDYVDDSLDDKITKNTDAELNAFIMPTYNSSGVQNGKAKIMLYKDDTTGAITIEAEEIVE